MPDIGVFPNLPGLSWSVIKSPIFQTRIQRAVSGRELRALDYPFPLWQFSLTYDFLRDNQAGGFNDLRKMMGFFALCQGAFGSFLFNDPTDNTVTKGVLPGASSTVSAWAVNAAGSGFVGGDVVTLSIGANGVNHGSFGGSGFPASWLVTAVGGGGALFNGGLSLITGGSHYIIPGSSGIALTGGSGTGATMNVNHWTTTTQLVRVLGDASLPAGSYPGNPMGLFGLGGFVEPITAPNVVSALYFNDFPQSPSSIDPASGIITLLNPFTPFYQVSTFTIANAGTSYRVNDYLTLSGGTLAPSNPPITDSLVGATMFRVQTVNGSGGITQASSFNAGNYTAVPGVSGLAVTGGSGSGATFNIAWVPIGQPIIMADFTYYFRCRFIDDSYAFENFVHNLWQLKKLAFISIRP